MKSLRVPGVLFLCMVVVSGFGQAKQSEFFRISSPPNAVITGFDPVAGTLSYSNAVAGTTNQLQRSDNLSGTSNWVDFVQLVSNASVITETILDLDPPEGMAYIPAGIFQMGDSFGEFMANELPVHSVYISEFYIDKYEVTKQLWDEVYSWATNNSYSFSNAGLGKAANHPVHTVSWYDCAMWCNARSEIEGRTPCYNLSTWSCDFSANGYRLPTGAEWEKAARGGLNGKRFGWGDSISHSNANYQSNTYFVYDVNPTSGLHPDYLEGDSPHSSPVGSFAPNAYGVYDMAGNQVEWCNDWLSATYYASSPSSNPRGPAAGSFRECRGGNWSSWATDCRSARHFGYTPPVARLGIGFRTVRSAKP